MKKSSLLSVLSMALATLTLCLAACNSGLTPQDTTADTIGTSAITDAITQGQDTTANTQAETETEAETEAETIFNPTVEIPDTSQLDITPLLAGDAVQLSYEKNFAGSNLSSLKTDNSLKFVNGSLFKADSNGLTCDNSGWDSVGFTQKVTTQNYTFTATLYAYENDRGGNYNAVMAGVRVKQDNHLFIDSGVWFSFRENTAAVYIKGGFERTLTSSLPFAAGDGITLKVVEDETGMTVYANETLIATAAIENDKITLYNAQGKSVGSHSTDNIATDSYGYMRAMSHYAFSSIADMSLTGQTNTPYQPTQSVYAFASGLSYAFCEKEQQLATIPVAVYADTYYADAFMLARMFGWDAVSEGDTLILQKDDVMLTFVDQSAIVQVRKEGQEGEASYPFPTTIKRDDCPALAVEAFVTMQGYATQIENGLLIVAGQKALITKENIQMAQDRFDLYRDVVYNYADVECGQKGVGKFDAVDPSERLVGMAYTTWHTSSRPWGSGTWDIPLYGTYTSDDPDVIYRHGVMLRDAGVDFVFIDWSNNTEYNPATMREQRPDFRMIEEATDLLFDIWATIPGAPKICIFVGPGHNGPGTISNGAHQKKVDQVWRDYVTNPDRADMYFYYLDKPLLICYGATPTQYSATPSNMWDDDRFTVRWMTGYVGQQGSLHNSVLSSRSYWSWEERGEQTFAIHNGYVEAVTVTAATRSQGKEGDQNYIPAAGRDNGATLKKQFQRACDLGSKFVIVVSWNEWTTGEQPSPEISKDIEPSVIHGTFYYDLLREQIKKFKGLVNTDN